MDNYEYLEPGFNPSSITIPQLRNILNKHDVSYNSSAKKAELVALFKENITPRASDLLSAVSKVSPRGSDIFDAPVRRARSTSPVKKSAASSPKKVTKKTTAAKKKENVEEAETEVEDIEQPLKSAKKRSRKATETTVTEETVEEKPKKKRASKSTESPRKASKKKEEEGEDLKTSPNSKASSPFSKENVFQKASPKTPATRGRKRALSTKETKESGEPPVSKVKTAAADDENDNEPSKLSNVINSTSHVVGSIISTPQQAARRLSNYLTPSTPVTTDNVVPTRSEGSRSANSSGKAESSSFSLKPKLPNLHVSQLRDQVRAATGGVRDSLPSLPTFKNTEPEPSSTKKKAGSEQTKKPKIVRTKISSKPKARLRLPSFAAVLTVLFQILFVVSVSGYIWFWVHERFAAGYCDVGFENDYDKLYSGYEYVDKALDHIRPSCELCPEHAVCYPGYVLVCDDDYQYVGNPLSLGGYLPFSPRCIPDTEKQRKVAILGEKIRQVLSQRNGEVECGELDEPAFVYEDDLEEELRKIKSSKLSDEEYGELWTSAVKDLEEDEEIIVSQQ